MRLLLAASFFRMTTEHRGALGSIEPILPRLGRIMDSLIWLAQTFKVLSLLMTSLTFFDSLWARSLTSPVPLSFHSLSTLENRKSLALLFNQLYSSNPSMFRWKSAHILNRTSSSSSWVFASTCSVSLTTGSNWGSCSSVYCVCNRCGWSG